MSIFFHICWRNLWRHKRRSLIVISSVAVGVFAMISAMGLLNGIMEQMVDNTIHTALGHISIQVRGFQGSLRSDHSFMPSSALYAAIERISPPKKGYAPRVKLKGIARSSASSRPIVITGIDPTKEQSVSHLVHYIVPGTGTFFERPDEDSVLISKNMADAMEISPGDKLIVMIQNSKGELSAAGMTVKALFITPVEGFDRHTIFMGIEKLQSFAGFGKNISEISITLKDRRLSRTAKAELIRTAQAEGLDVLTWEEMAPNLVRSIMIVDTMMYISFFIIFITVIFSIANTLVMAIMERFREIGVMKSIGTSPRMVFYMVVFESMLLGVTGLVGGIAFGYAAMMLLSVTGIDLSVYSETLRAMGSGSIIYPSVRAFDVFMASTIVLFTAFCAAIVPARKAAQIEPVKALAYI
jgi:ABC-type lipoprotein release transport system permease subunit